MGKQVNQTELAEIMGVSDVTIWEWQKQGLPIKVRNVRGQSNTYDTAEVIDWKVAREVAKIGGVETQDQRLKRVQADKIEMENAVTRRELLPAGEIEARWASLVIAARQRLLQVPDRLAQMLEITPGAAAKRGLLIEEIDGALAELADNDDSQPILSEFLERLYQRLADEPAAGGRAESAGEVGAAAASIDGGLGGGEALPQ